MEIQNNELYKIDINKINIGRHLMITFKNGIPAKNKTISKPIVLIESYFNQKNGSFRIPLQLSPMPKFSSLYFPLIVTGLVPKSLKAKVLHNPSMRSLRLTDEIMNINGVYY